MIDPERKPTLNADAGPQEAKAYVEGLVRWIGPGFHPDTDFKDYVTPENIHCFTKEESVRLNEELERAVGILSEAGADVYQIGLRVQRLILHARGVR